MHVNMHQKWQQKEKQQISVESNNLFVNKKNYIFASKRRLSRDEMSEEQKLKLREADRKRKALQRENETEEQRMQRLENKRIRTAESIADETEEQRIQRLENKSNRNWFNRRMFLTWTIICSNVKNTRFKSAIYTDRQQQRNKKYCIWTSIKIMKK